MAPKVRRLKRPEPLRAFRRWRCRRAFARLSEANKAVVRLVGDDPDSLIDRGKL
ncbi:MAG TPA: hypothetical protein VFL54_03780 [Gammaproteobacteria bacterium]|nr:hypothetical protein [Gammaproteobacteria bacterium]